MNELTSQKNILLLLKLDAKNLFERIYSRRKEYITIFSVHRTRKPFSEVFRSRYDSTTIESLSGCGVETIHALNQFYTEVDELKWYLDYTEDMPNTVEEKVESSVIKLKKLYETLMLFLDVELGIHNEQTEDMLPPEKLL